MAASWIVTPSVELRETLTDNVNLAPSDQARSDLVTEITPSVAFRGIGPHARIAGTIAVPTLLYARTGSQNNQVYPEIAIAANAELVERLFYVDAAINVTQPFLSPFGGQPLSLTTATNNRYTSSSYVVSPYLKGLLPGNIEYELRDTVTFTKASQTPVDTSDAFVNQVIGHVASAVTPFGWFADLNATDVKFSDQSTQRLNLVRTGPRYAISPLLRVQASVGYEDDNFPGAEYSNVIYGANVQWRPSPRTTASAAVEHRFFGTSFLARLEYRTPLTAWTVEASRNLSIYPQQVSTWTTVPSAGGLLDQLFRSRIPDPDLREQAAASYLQGQAIPTTLATAVNIYTQQILLTNNVTVAAALTGSRNSVFLSAYYSRNEPIAGTSTVETADQALNTNTQIGTSVIWAYRLTPVTNINSTLFATRTRANPPFAGYTNQAGARIEVDHFLSPRTRVFAGARHQALRSDLATEYTESAVFAGVGYTFK